MKKPIKLYKRIRYSLTVLGVLHFLAMNAPHRTLRTFFYRMRGSRIGQNVYISPGVFLEEHYPELITIEDQVEIGPKTIIVTHDSSPTCIDKSQGIKRGPVHIKKGAYIGAGVIILPGVTIGERAIIGAGAVVTKDVPGNVVAKGVPAKITREFKEK
jgi:acetyltransferase-like isoleucine patch superfamily enzyme